jgi:hypothetical protein
VTACRTCCSAVHGLGRFKEGLLSTAAVATVIVHLLQLRGGALAARGLCTAAALRFGTAANSVLLCVIVQAAKAAALLNSDDKQTHRADSVSNLLRSLICVCVVCIVCVLVKTPAQKRQFVRGVRKLLLLPLQAWLPFEEEARRMQHCSTRNT